MYCWHGRCEDDGGLLRGIVVAWGSSRSSRGASQAPAGSSIDRKSIQFSFDSINTNGKSLSRKHNPETNTQTYKVSSAIPAQTNHLPRPEWSCGLGVDP